MGTNLWCLLVLVPALHVRPAAQTWLIGVAPLALLAYAALRRRPSTGILLCVVPLAMTVPLVLDRRFAGLGVFSWATMVIVGLSLLAYGWAACRVVVGVGDTPTRWQAVRQLRSSGACRPLPATLTQAVLPVLAAICSLGLLHSFSTLGAEDSSVGAFYPDRIEEFRVLFGLLAVLIWLGLLLRFFSVPLMEAMQGSQALRLRLQGLRTPLRRPHRWTYFWMIVVFAGISWAFASGLFLAGG